MAASLVGLLLFPGIIWLCHMSHDKVIAQEVLLLCLSALKQRESSGLTHVEQR
jgi:hypothetical protein